MGEHSLVQEGLGKDSRWRHLPFFLSGESLPETIHTWGRGGVGFPLCVIALSSELDLPSRSGSSGCGRGLLCMCVVGSGLQDILRKWTLNGFPGLAKVLKKGFEFRVRMMGGEVEVIYLHFPLFHFGISNLAAPPFIGFHVGRQESEGDSALHPISKDPQSGQRERQLLSRGGMCPIKS